jgi:hypothetical protein
MYVVDKYFARAAFWKGHCVSDKEVMDFYRVEYATEWRSMEKNGLYPSPTSVREILNIPKPTRTSRIKKWFK